jgi:Zn-dependent M16 (insulinase) family peptidase
VLKGSLTTYVNAMTANDLTSYICASRNDVDMQNLMSVYLDAVFQPLVVEEEGSWVFRQEGWRVEMNETGEPEFNGVVYSEMKGAISSPDSRMEYYAMTQLFPNVTYRFNSGGDPEVIPQLTQEELTSFYNTFYHPSNAQAYFYGTRASAENLLMQLDEYLQNYDARPDIRESSKIDLQPLVNIEPKVHQVPYSADEQEKDHKIMMSWMVSGDGKMDDEFQHENRLVYSVLDHLLMNDQNGILFKALQDSGLGSSIEGGIDKSIQQWTFDIIMSNIQADDIEAVRTVVKDTLGKVVKEGFHQEDIESAMNTVEFDFRDISSFTGPRGILMWMRIMDTWKFDLHPLTGLLSFEDDIARLKQNIEKHGSDVFTKIITDHVLNNQHNVVIDLYPEPTLAAEEAQVRNTDVLRIISIVVLCSPYLTFHDSSRCGL